MHEKQLHNEPNGQSSLKLEKKAYNEIEQAIQRLKKIHESLEQVQLELNRHKNGF